MITFYFYNIDYFKKINFYANADFIVIQFCDI